MTLIRLLRFMARAANEYAWVTYRGAPFYPTARAGFVPCGPSTLPPGYAAGRAVKFERLKRRIFYGGIPTRRLIPAMLRAGFPDECIPW